MTVLAFIGGAVIGAGILSSFLFWIFRDFQVWH
jgi:hypothetical protein